MAFSIGIYTQYYDNYNYGGNLQAFSLQRYIDNNIGKCEQVAIDFEYKKDIFYYLNNIKNSKGKKPNAVFIAIKYIAKNTLFLDAFIRLKQRRNRIKVFNNYILHSKNLFNVENVTESLNYSNYICGSDCVWDMTNNPYCTALGFVPDKGKKISYAASLGSSAIPKGWPEKFLEYVKQLDAISVREKSIAEELQKLIPEKDIFVAADPTLLFTVNEWESFLYHKERNEKYVLHYILSEEHSQIQSALKYTSNISFKSLTFPYIQNCINRNSFWQRNYGDIQNYSADPLDFVELIKNAEVVVTDSFHAVIFSTLFHKPFYVLKRETQKDYVGRVENFLEEIGLMSQMISAEELAAIDSVPEIDFSYADKVIAEKREASIKFLKDNLE
ncbi:MAG: polysaccharide pyruvyl transferase family protein [Clostridia bacterium]|nr:polysaccharide pyruvyl transferase family protein [Clostridia bacterium]